MTGASTVSLVAVAGTLAGMASPEVIADAWRRGREAYRDAGRARALYTRCRSRIEILERQVGGWSVDRHQAAERWLRVVAGTRLGSAGRA